MRLWDLEAGKEIGRVEADAMRGGVVAVAFAPDGKAIVAAGVDRVIRVFDLESGAERRRFEGHEDAVTGLVFTRTAPSSSRRARTGRRSGGD